MIRWTKISNPIDKLVWGGGEEEGAATMCAGFSDRGRVEELP